MRCESGNPCIMGCNRIENGYNFAYDCSTDTDIKLCFFDRDTLELKEKIPLKKRMGTVHSVCVCDDNIERMLYCYKADDEYIVDPYAKAVTGCEVFGVEQENTLHLSPVKLESFNWEGDVPLHLPYNDCVFYKLNVRGFTKSRSSKVKAKGTFRGIVEKIPYLKELGITTLEFMPAYEFDEAYRFPQFIDSSEYLRYGVIKGSIYNNTVTKKAEKLNCWGYTKAFYYAPKASYSIPAEDNISEKAGKYNDYTTEFKNMVKCLHNNGIEVVMEFFFDGVKTAYILECVRYWVREYHIDGVHLYCDEHSLNVLAADPQLADTKIITVGWNSDRGTYKHMASCNNDAQNTIRRYLKGDEDMLRPFINMAGANPYNAAVINYVASNNGFTLYDLVSYDRKHNELNGENNRDGENYNFSWNCGEEGSTRKLKVRQLRIKQIKNALVMVILSQGTPLILAGDEFMNTQQGNNNPYCIDSELSWVNWRTSNDSMQILEWTKKLIGLRKKYGILHSRENLSLSDSKSLGYPDMSYHGSNAWYADMENYCRQIGIMYCNSYADDKSRSLIYIAYNMHWEKHNLALPKVEGSSFKIIAATNDGQDKAFIDKEARSVCVPERSIAILVAEYLEKKKARITRKDTKSYNIRKGKS